MRKISVGNKSKFLAFTVVILVIIILFIRGLRLSLGMKKNTYTLESGSFLYDIEYNPVKTEQNATLKQKWNGNYYLKEGEKNENKEEFNIGKEAVSYKPTRRSLELYGNFFEIKADGSVTKYYDKNEINDTSTDRFYKIADRKYLIISRNITNPTRSLNTKDYLIVVLDKAGNAQIMNNELNAKMLSKTYIDTPTFEFDVANEKLQFENNTLDLKKIIGSTNEFKELPKKKQEENQIKQTELVEGNNTEENNEQGQGQAEATAIASAGGTGSGGSGEETIIQVNTGSNQSGSAGAIAGTAIAGAASGTTSGTSMGTNMGNSSNKQQNQVFDKSVTINKVTAGVSHIDVNYYIIDPQGQYKAVYMVVEGNGENRSIALDKSNTNYRITGLDSNTNYKITFSSKSVNSKGTTIDVIEDVTETRTLKNRSTIKITRVAGGKVYYNLKLDPNYVIDSGTLALYVDGQRVNSTPVNLQSVYTSGGWSGSFSYQNAREIALRVEDVIYDGSESDVSIYTKIKF